MPEDLLEALKLVNKSSCADEIEQGLLSPEEMQHVALYCRDIRRVCLLILDRIQYRQELIDARNNVL